MFRRDWYSPPTKPGRVLPSFLYRHTGVRNEGTRQLLSKTGRGRGGGANRKGCRRGLSQKPRPACNGQDMLTDSQAGGGESGPVEWTCQERATSYVGMETDALAQARGRGL